MAGVEVEMKIVNGNLKTPVCVEEPYKWSKVNETMLKMKSDLVMGQLFAPLRIGFSLSKT